MTLENNELKRIFECEWTPKYYHRYNIIILLFFSPFLLLFVLAGINEMINGSTFGGLLYTFFMLSLLGLLVFKTLNIYEKKKVIKISIDDKGIVLTYITHNSKEESINLRKQDVKVTYKVVSNGRQYMENIEIEDKNQNIYYLINTHGLWRTENNQKIFSVFQKLKYKRRTLK